MTMSNSAGDFPLFLSHLFIIVKQNQAAPNLLIQTWKTITFIVIRNKSIKLTIMLSILFSCKAKLN